MGAVAYTDSDLILPIDNDVFNLCKMAVASFFELGCKLSEMFLLTDQDFELTTLVPCCLDICPLMSGSPNHCWLVDPECSFRLVIRKSVCSPLPSRLLLRSNGGAFQRLLSGSRRQVQVLKVERSSVRTRETLVDRRQLTLQEKTEVTRLSLLWMLTTCLSCVGCTHLVYHYLSCRQRHRI